MCLCKKQKHVKFLIQELEIQIGNQENFIYYGINSYNLIEGLMDIYKISRYFKEF
uniref:Uncharacterized protein n=1 Tax=Rhizophagus irregularis (strain DAOM 181602 / DAOM 197198 / MUCL 43194) TaxID=747089 RepID=U9UKC9_RHIID